MLRKFLVVSLAVLTLASCKKDKNDKPAYHFSAKIDGVKKDFNYSVLAQLLGDNQSGYNLFIIGVGGNSVNPLPTFDLDINADAPIETKTYQTIQSQSQWEADGSYWLDGQTSYDSDGQDFSITITSLTATGVKGTFSGTIEDRSTGDINTITEGTFSAKLQ